MHFPSGRCLRRDAHCGRHDRPVSRQRHGCHRCVFHGRQRWHGDWFKHVRREVSSFLLLPRLLLVALVGVAASTTLLTIILAGLQTRCHEHEDIPANRHLRRPSVGPDAVYQHRGGPGAALLVREQVQRHWYASFISLFSSKRPNVRSARQA